MNRMRYGKPLAHNGHDRYYYMRRVKDIGRIVTVGIWAATIVGLSGIFPGWMMPMGLLPAQAETLTDRLATYPNWQHKPSTQVAQGDLSYPRWIAGTWQLTTTLVDMVAPFAPAIVTPGFESNRAFMHQPIAFTVRFVPRSNATAPGTAQAGTAQAGPAQAGPAQAGTIVADRAFNGLNIAQVYLGEDLVRAVKVDPGNPNRQITILKGDRQLESTITDRAVETPNPSHFVTSELFQQIFRGTNQPYLNQVETTTAYTHYGGTPRNEPRDENLGDQPVAPIVADQVTAIYLSPQDPDYFKVGESPVALYRYKLEFFRSKT